MTLSITIFSIMTLSITTFTITTFSMMTLSITTFSIIKLSIKDLHVTLSITILCIIVNVVMLNVVFYLLC